MKYRVWLYKLSERVPLTVIYLLTHPLSRSSIFLRPGSSCCFPRRTCSSAKPPRYARGLPPTQQSGQFVSVFPRTVRASSRPGPDRRYEELTGRQERSKPPDERMEEQSRRRGAQQGAEGESAGRAVGADFLMTYWAVSPHPHRVCAYLIP